MISSRKVFNGINATLVIGKDSITIERPLRFALQHNGQRKTTIAFEDLAEVRHQQSAARPGYLQFSIKSGTDGVTALTRVNKIHFDHKEAFKFRRAKNIINSEIDRISNSSSRTSRTTRPIRRASNSRTAGPSLGFRRPL